MHVFRCLLPLGIALAAICMSPHVLRGQQDGGSAVERASEWKLESLHLKNGKVHRGLIRAVREDEIEFVEIVRPPGKRMYLVLMSFNPRSVARSERLSRDERRELFTNIKPLLTIKSYALIEAGRMEDVELAEMNRDGRRWLTCDQSWFRVESTADEESTRRCVVRIEQIFRAFRGVLPPRVEQQRSVRLLLLGSMDEYRRYLQEQSLTIDNPAFYSAETNTIVAGSDLRIYSERMVRIRAQCEALRKRYIEQNRQFKQQLVELTAQMKSQGFSKQEIDTEQRVRKAAWDREYTSMVGADGEGGKIGETIRSNEGRFNDVTGQMFRRLYHEAFHAYLEHNVFPHHRTQMPRWLNEGLAQIFENGQLDADTLRLHAPRRETLLGLQRDLLSGQPLSLAEVLAADQRAYLVTHGEKLASQRHYLYSWGLAWYLTFQQDLLGRDDLERYVDPKEPARWPIERFEQLVGKPLLDFEDQWRRHMLEMIPPAK